MIVISRVTSNGRNVPEISLIGLDSLSGSTNWSSIHSHVLQNYFIDRTQNLATAGIKIGLYPWPEDITSTTTLVVNYYAYATDLVGYSDIPFNAITYLYPYHDTLIYYTSSIIYAVEGESDKAKDYMSLYASEVQLMIQNVGKRPNYLPSMAGPANGR